MIEAVRIVPVGVVDPALLARLARALERARERLVHARDVIGHGQISGAVGTYNTVDPEVVTRLLLSAETP